MKREREYNYDLLRVISMIAVLMIHISGTWISSYTQHISDNGYITNTGNALISCIYNAISRFAVPCFIMLSGAFILDSNKTYNYHDFYQSKLKKIAIPTVIFSILYIIYSLFLSIMDKQNLVAKLILVLKNTIKGEPFYHMWFMFVLIGLYLISPIVVRFKDSIPDNLFSKIIIIFFVLSILSRWTTSNVQLSWDIGQIFEYLGYYMIGYVLRKNLKKSNFKGIILIICGIVIEIIAAFIKYKYQLQAGIEESELALTIVSPYSPIIACASLCIFSGFTMLSVNHNKCVEKLSKLSFIIYLVHAGVWDIITKAISFIRGKEIFIHLNCTYYIPMSIIIVLIISVIISLIYNKFEVMATKNNYLQR